jgi:hypothetical protein
MVVFCFQRLRLPISSRSAGLHPVTFARYYALAIALVLKVLQRELGGNLRVHETGQNTLLVLLVLFSRTNGTNRPKPTAQPPCGQEEDMLSLIFRPRGRHSMPQDCPGFRRSHNLKTVVLIPKGW